MRSPGRTTTNGEPPADGRWESGAPQPIDPATGQHGAYWVLTEAERARGFVRPVRHAYVHRGPGGPTHALRELSADEQVRYKNERYVRAEDYPPERAPLVARFWTQAQLERARIGCGAETRMGTAIAETWARDVNFYGSTFCIACRGHFPVDEFLWIDASGRVTSEVLGS